MSVKEPREGHLCCGSAGTYNIMQPEIATELRDRKVKNIAATGADVVATGNIGCITQIADRAGMPIVHTVQLLDWAYGGPKPNGLVDRKTKRAALPLRRAALCGRPEHPLRSLRAPPADHMTITLVPTLTRSNRSTTSSLRMRMQPDETLVPMVHGALVPWMR